MAKLQPIEIVLTADAEDFFRRARELSGQMFNIAIQQRDEARRQLAREKEGHADARRQMVKYWNEWRRERAEAAKCVRLLIAFARHYSKYMAREAEDLYEPYLASWRALPAWMRKEIEHD